MTEPPTGPEVSGRGLVLRSWQDDDRPRMSEIFGDADVHAWTKTDSPFDAAAADRYLTRARQRYRDHEARQWALTTDGGPALGEVLIFLGLPDQPLAEIGYAVAAGQRRRGLASRAVLLVIDHAAAELGKEVFQLRIAVGNEASAAVARRCGFTPHQTQTRETRGRLVDLAIWQRYA
jgi:RimJ/RimL family protein N-acetyltransferase